MSDITENRPDKIVAQYRALVQGCTHLQFAINGTSGAAPEIAHVPFFYQPKDDLHDTFVLYILGSMLSSASRALYHLAESSATQSCSKQESKQEFDHALSILLLDAAKQDVDPYAQARVTFSARVDLIDRTSPQWLLATKGLAARHGDIVHTLTALQDFNCFAIRPFLGRFVKGFGKAFKLSGNDLQEWTHLRQS